MAKPLGPRPAAKMLTREEILPIAAMLLAPIGIHAADAESNRQYLERAAKAAIALAKEVDRQLLEHDPSGHKPNSVPHRRLQHAQRWSAPRRRGSKPVGNYFVRLLRGRSQISWYL
jgi:hypothetical protein